MGYSIGQGIESHPHEEEGVAEPLHCLTDVGDCAQGNLCVHVGVHVRACTCVLCECACVCVCVCAWGGGGGGGGGGSVSISISSFNPGMLHVQCRRFSSAAYLSIEVVRETADKLALDWLLPCEQGEIVGQFVMCRDDGPFTIVVKLRPTRTTKDLEYIQDA